MKNREFVTILTLIKTKENPMRRKITYITEAGVIAALYVALTMLSASVGLSSGPIQCRLSEALCLLPVLFPSAVPGVAIGCLISNLILSGSLFDVVLGTAATLVGALGARLIGRGRLIFPASVPTVIANAAAIPLILKLMDVPDIAYLYTAFTVALGEIISCTVLGPLFVLLIERSGIANINKKG
ncbi:MAG: QueT transporter family protein [Clostridia bacterium]|nr:QueT transporter family protein [Clostridia bacterium]